MTNKKLRFYNRHMFRPSLIGLILNPFYIARVGLYNTLRKHVPATNNCKILDVGCGNMPYKHLFKDMAAYHGLEIDTTVHKTTQADFFYDGNIFPFADDSYDVVMCNQVLEHVFTPDSFLTEIDRILTDNGQLILTVPFIWDEHEQPYDYARYSSFGLKSLLQKNGFEITSSVKISPNISVLFQLLNAYLYKMVHKTPMFIKLICFAIFTFPATVMGIVLGTILPNNPDIYLDNFIIAKKLTVPAPASPC